VILEENIERKYKMKIEDFMRTATAEQIKLLSDICTTAEQEQRLANSLKRVRDSIPRGIHSSDGFGLTICEDEDDARVISAAERQKLQGVREQMKTYMQEAVRLGMGSLGIVQRSYEHYVGKPLPMNTT